MNILQSYHNSVYNKYGTNSGSINSGHSFDTSTIQEQIKHNERKELQEINNRLSVYVRTVRELSENRNYLSDQSVNLLNSLKYLENDLENLKQLYENEFKHLRSQVDTLSKDKNKLLIDNQNYDRNCRDLTQKLSEEKNANKKLTDELLEIRTRNNELEYLLEKMRIEIDKPTRDLNQLQMEYNNLKSSYLDTRQKLDIETATKQNLDAKLNDLNDKFTFSTRFYEQEIDSLRSQLSLAKSAVSDLDTKLKDTQSSDTSISNLFEKLRDKAERELEAYKKESQELFQKNINSLNDQLKDSKQSNENLRNEIAKYDQRYQSLKNLCQNLEATIHSSEANRNILENDLIEQKTKAIRNLNEMEIKLEGLQQLLLNTYEATNQPVVSLNVEIEVLKELLNEEEKILQQLTFTNNTTNTGTKNNFLENRINNLENRINLMANDSTIETLYQLNYSPSNENTDETNQTENQSNFIFSKFHLTPTGGPIGPITNRKTQSAGVKSPTNSTPLQEISTNETSFLVQSLNTNTNTNTNDKYKSSSSYSRSRPSPPHSSLPKPQSAKDYTTELFTKYHKSKFDDAKIQVYNSVELPAESSYVGNIKIHEVNKNGYYIRLLNVSNNCDEDISSWTIQQIVSSMPVAIYQFPENLTLQSGQTVTVWARTDEVEQQAPHTFVWKDQTKWGTGAECTTVLAKPNGQAVSWTTGSHKYGSIDYDEIASVFTKPQKRTRSAVHLIREKMNPHSLIKSSPSKYPQKSLTRSNSNRGGINNGYTSLFNEKNSTTIPPLKARLAKSAVTRRSDIPQYMQQISSTTPLATSYFKNVSREDLSNEC